MTKASGTTPNMKAAKLIRAYAQRALDENGDTTADNMPLARAIVTTNASTAEACCFMGRALLLIEDGLSDPPYRIGGAMCDPAKTTIAQRLGMG